MSKVLVIKGANFNTNKLATVTFMDIPCTAISISANATISTVGGQTTLTAVKTPNNATDETIWQSSNINVATVSNGVVTAVNEGTAIITVTCGTASALCTVTVAYEKTFAKEGLLCVNLNGTTAIYDFATMYVSGLKPVTVGVKSGTFPAYGASSIDSTNGFYDLYPIPLPAGCKKIAVTCANMAPLIVYYSKGVKSSHNALTREAAKVLDGQTTTGGTSWSIGTWTYNSKTFTVPETAGIDSYTLSFQCNADSVRDNFSLNDITIEYQFS